MSIFMEHQANVDQKAGELNRKQPRICRQTADASTTLISLALLSAFIPNDTNPVRLSAFQV